MSQNDTAALVDTAPVQYVAYDGRTLVWRPCRTWSTPDGFVAVVTEIGDGRSVTNAAELVFDAVQNVRPGARVIEHYPPTTHQAETFDEITVSGKGVPTWRRIPLGDLRALLGPDLDATRPAQPVDIAAGHR